MPTNPKIPADVRSLSFEAAMEELELIVRKLEEGDVDLDNAIEAYARGAILKLHCENKLSDAKSRIDKIVLNDNGNSDAEPFDLE